VCALPDPHPTSPLHPSFLGPPLPVPLLELLCTLPY
jgi:hypothetical protein